MAWHNKIHQILTAHRDQKCQRAIRDSTDTDSRVWIQQLLLSWVCGSQNRCDFLIKSKSLNHIQTQIRGQSVQVKCIQTSLHCLTGKPWAFVWLCTACNAGIQLGSGSVWDYSGSWAPPRHLLAQHRTDKKWKKLLLWPGTVEVKENGNTIKTYSKRWKRLLNMKHGYLCTN